MKVSFYIFPLVALVFVSSAANAITPDKIAYCQDKAKQQLDYERQMNSIAEKGARDDMMLKMIDPMLAQQLSMKSLIKSKEQIMQVVKQVYDDCLEKFGSEESQENEIKNWGSSNRIPPSKQPFQESAPGLAKSPNQSSSAGINSLDLYNRQTAACNAQPNKVWTASGCRNLSDVVTNYGVKNYGVGGR